jgi:carotenoid cleavage dioxygenase
MIHAVTLRDGKASYRNAWVRTKGLEAEIRAGRPLYGSYGHAGKPVDPSLIGPNGDPGPFKNVVHINFVCHAGRYLALHGPTMPYELTADLKTIGEYNFNGAVKKGFSGHPKIDPRTGEMFGFYYGIQKPYLHFYAVNPQGVVSVSQPIDTENPAFHHDFVITENYAVFFILPAFLNPDASLTWHSKVPVQIYVVPRNGDVSKAKVYEADPFFVFHFINAYEEGSKIIIDYTRWKAFGTGIPKGPNGSNGQEVTLARMVVNQETGQAQETILDDRFNEFPRINDNLIGQKHRYSFVPTRTRRGEEWMLNALFRYDYEKQTHVVQDYGDRFECGEPIFVPKADGTEELDGWLMHLVSDWDRKHSELRIYDARYIAEDPVAVVEMPRRVPHGIHGNWVPER